MKKISETQRIRHINETKRTVLTNSYILMERYDNRTVVEKIIDFIKYRLIYRGDCPFKPVRK